MLLLLLLLVLFHGYLLPDLKWHVLKINSRLKYHNTRKKKTNTKNLLPFFVCVLLLWRLFLTIVSYEVWLKNGEEEEA